MVNLKREKGNVVVLFAVGLVAFLGLAAVVVDAGSLYAERLRLQTAADAAALASLGKLPGDPAGARQLAIDNLAANKAEGAVSVEVGNRKVWVTTQSVKQLAFAKALGFNQATVQASARAEVKVITGTTGVVPLGVAKEDFVIGQQVTLKYGASGGDGPGNFHALALGGTGANVFQNNLANGFANKLKAGDWVDTETGNMAGPTDVGISTRIDKDPTATYTNYKPGSPRILIVPIMETFSVDGRKPIQVLGFGAFFIESNVSEAEVRGRFIRYAMEGDTAASGTDYGLQKIGLIK